MFGCLKSNLTESYNLVNVCHKHKKHFNELVEKISRQLV